MIPSIKNFGGTEESMKKPIQGVDGMKPWASIWYSYSIQCSVMSPRKISGPPLMPTPTKRVSCRLQWFSSGAWLLPLWPLGASQYQDW